MFGERKAIVKILFIETPIRNLIFWPFSVGFLQAGNEIHRLQIDEAKSVSHQISEELRQTDFDLIIATDWLGYEDGKPVNKLFRHPPKMICVQFNSLSYGILESMSVCGDDAQMEEDGVLLGFFCKESQDNPFTTRAIYMPYGISDVALSSAQNFYQFLAGDIAPGTVLPNLKRTLMQTAQLYAQNNRPAPKSDLLYLGLHQTNPEMEAEFLQKSKMPLSVDYQDLMDKYDETLPDHVYAPSQILEDLEEAISQDGLHKQYLKEHFYARAQFKNRRVLCHEVSKHFGDRLSLSENWKEEGLPGQIGMYQMNDLQYLQAKICLDFGGGSFADVLYPRSTHILQSGGFVLQLRTNESLDIFGAFTNDMTFETSDELVQKIEFFLNNNRARRQLQKDVHAHLVKTVSAQKSAETILAQLQSF